MPIRAVKGGLDQIQGLRTEHLREMHCQVVRDALHRRPGWAEWYLAEANGSTVGYLALAVGGAWAGARTVFEFYLRPDYRSSLDECFRTLVEAAAATDLVVQTNDRLLFDVGRRCAELTEEAILFSDGGPTTLRVADAQVVLTAQLPESAVFEHKVEPVGKYSLVVAGDLVGTGGVLTHYNPPYADLHMEVREDRRRSGYGSFLVQELKRITHEQGLVPCARCDVVNVASLRTLSRAGMRECGRLLRGRFSR